MDSFKLRELDEKTSVPTEFYRKVEESLDRKLKEESQAFHKSNIEKKVCFKTAVLCHYCNHR